MRTCHWHPLSACCWRRRPPHTRKRQPSRRPTSRGWKSTGSRCSTSGYDFKHEQPRLVRCRATHASSLRFAREFGDDGRFYSGVRQSRFGVKTYTPTDLGELRTTFEFELFGVGVDAGPDDVPAAPCVRRAGRSSGPGRPGARSWTSTCSRTPSSTGARTGWCSSGTCSSDGCRSRDDTRLTLALERPGASADQGRFADRIELQNVLGTISAAGLLRRVPARRGTGAMSRRPASSAASTSTTSSQTRSISRADDLGLGHQPELEPQADRSGHLQAAAAYSAQASRTT